ncbi:flagellar basal-body rod protein FlgG [Candidatus Raskinella chloraquaticus]|jgi:flagellar basal-body rod protein FlgG|uniref:flagellar basal-body rod protein FlgG n=1 Tax=Candidatus Raskinella chloraquaticus TaxID=1951219 RepID=UPI00366C6EEB
MQAIRTAATGMAAQELNVTVISNNIANLRTTGFKRQRAEFQDLLYLNLRRAGTSTSQSNTIVPSAIELGTGVRTGATPRIHTQGSLQQTDKDFDIAIRGEGYFRVTLPDGRTAYSRDGSFQTDAQGQIVTKDGYVLDPAITVPQNATAITISGTGVVQATVPGQTAPQDVGQIQLARFINKSGLESLGDNLFIETAASGAAQAANPGAEGYGTLQQKFLEEANVNAVTEISDLIAAQRAYEMNARVIRSGDELLQATAQLGR